LTTKIDGFLSFKEKTGWNSVYHQNWWFSEFQRKDRMKIWPPKLMVFWVSSPVEC
jgi:hypothetical protein